MMPLHLLFSPLDGAPGMVFVEAENDKGRSVQIGRWEFVPGDRVDLYKLVITEEDVRNINIG